MQQADASGAGVGKVTPHGVVGSVGARQATQEDIGGRARMRSAGRRWRRAWGCAWPVGCCLACACGS